jgi:transcription elongation GreA/GreB family factor
LKENSEYKMAKQDQTTAMARKAQLETDLGRSRITDFTDASKTQVSVGSVVEVIQGGAKKSTRYAILGAWDSNPDKNVLSYKTPLAQALIGKKAGDSVETDIGGSKETWAIKSLARWVDEQK